MSATKSKLEFIIRASLIADGNMQVTMTITDKLDLRNEGNRNIGYRVAVGLLGFFYHDVLGGTDNMTTSATWTINKP
jgi:hypothetical protein